MICPRFIEEMRRSRNLSQVDLAERVGTSQGFVSNVLSGERPVPDEQMDAWMDALELTQEQRALFKRYAIRSYAAPCANEFLDALDDTNARLQALERELAATNTAFETMKRYSEALERENAALRAADPDARRRSG